MKYYAVHNSAVSRKVQPLQRDIINNYHKSKWGMKSSLGWYIGYNRYTEPDGSRTEARALNEETIANVGHNCDVPSRCDTISHCLGGYFKVEKPTLHQVNDVIDGFNEAKKKWPKIQLVQHNDLQANRTCAELSPEYLQSWLSDDDCESQLARVTKERDTYKSITHQLIKHLTK